MRNPLRIFDGIRTFIYRLRLLKRLKDQRDYIIELHKEAQELADSNKQLAHKLHETSAKLEAHRNAAASSETKRVG